MKAVIYKSLQPLESSGNSLKSGAGRVLNRALIDWRLQRLCEREIATVSVQSRDAFERNQWLERAQFWSIEADFFEGAPLRQADAREATLFLADGAFEFSHELSLVDVRGVGSRKPAAPSAGEIERRTFMTTPGASAALCDYSGKNLDGLLDRARRMPVGSVFVEWQYAAVRVFPESDAAYLSLNAQMLQLSESLALWAKQETPGVYRGPDAFIHPSATISGPTLIGRGAYVGAGARIGPLTVLEDGCYVAPGAYVEAAVIEKGGYVARGEERVRSIVRSTGVAPV